MPDSASPPERPFDRRRHPPGLAFQPWTAPDGWVHRAFRWPQRARSPRGSLLFQPGRADFLEKYLEACHHWWRRGWAVEGFDWRGQGGSGRLRPEGCDHRESFAPLVDDLAAYVAEWRARTPAPHVIVAHSMGGHVALRLLAERSPGLDAAVLVAPMVELYLKPVPRWAVRLLAGGMVRLGLGERAIRRQLGTEEERQARLTADRERFEDSQWWKAAHPELALGPPSWGWVNAALEGGAGLGAPGLLEGIACPVQFITAGRDRLVDNRAIAAAVRRMPVAELAPFPHAAHELLREIDPIRESVFAAIDRFLDDRAQA